VVTRDLPDGVVAAGAPAQIIKEIEFAPKNVEGARP
jgi:acetyltransferase-like isoleucine patch superfamily enzyme